MTLAYRGLNFLWPPLAILCSAGLFRLCSEAGRRGGRGFSWPGVACVAVVAAIALVNVYVVYAAVSLQERYLGYFWLYSRGEYEAGKWLSAACGGQAVAGDVKVSYLLKGYFNVDVDVARGLRYLASGGPKPRILAVYSQMQRNGYVVYGGYSVDLPRDWEERAERLNRVYSNGVVSVYSWWGP